MDPARPFFCLPALRQRQLLALAKFCLPASSTAVQALGTHHQAPGEAKSGSCFAHGTRLAWPRILLLLAATSTRGPHPQSLQFWRWPQAGLRTGRRSMW